MTVRLAIAALLAAAAWPATARADRREASVHAHLIGGVAATTDEHAGETRTGAAPLGGIAVRASYARRNHLQYDAAFALLATGAAGLGDGHFAPAGRPPVDGPYAIATQVARLDAGATLRLGVAWIPTLRLAAGAQARRRGAPVVDSASGTISGADAIGRGPELTADLVGSAAAGIDHRPSRRLVIGAALGGSIALPLDGHRFYTVELTLHAAYYWYPR